MSEGMPRELLPCPFCGGDDVEIHEKYTPPVMNRAPSVISVEVRHFCPKRKSQPHGMSVKQIGRDRQSAITAWNTRCHTEHQRALDALEVAREALVKADHFTLNGIVKP